MSVNKYLKKCLAVLMTVILISMMMPGEIQAEEAGLVSPITNLKLANCQSGVTITWSASADAEYYRIYRKIGSEKGTLVTTITDPGKVSFVDKSVMSDNGVTYKYIVKAYAGGQASEAVGKKIVRLTRVRPYGETKYKSMTVRWTKNSKATGYQIKYSTSRSFSGVKYATVRGASVTTKTFTKMPRGKTYYVRVRVFKTVGKVNYYSGWSNLVFGTIL